MARRFQGKRQNGFLVLGYEVGGVMTTRDGKRVEIKTARLADTSKYTGERLRGLRAGKGVGPVRRIAKCSTCLDTGHCMGAALHPTGHAEVEVYCYDCGPEHLRGHVW